MLDALAPLLKVPTKEYVNLSTPDLLSAVKDYQAFMSAVGSMFRRPRTEALIDELAKRLTEVNNG